MNGIQRFFITICTLIFSLSAQAAQLKINPQNLISSAREQIGITRYYDPAYVVLSYPGGDVPIERGVCTDVLIRALRQQNIDLQVLVNQDMKSHFSQYPKIWGLKSTDRNIDHRRVPNLETFFTRQKMKRTEIQQASDFKPGDIVTWRLPGNLPHIGIVSDRYAKTGNPLIIHNVGRGTQEEDVLFSWPITAHFRN